MLEIHKAVSVSMPTAHATLEYLLGYASTLEQQQAAVLAEETYTPSLSGKIVGVLRHDIHPTVALKLGINLGHNLSNDETANLLRGYRTDGTRINGRQYKRIGEDQVQIGYIDFTFRAPKSFSVALALAPDEAERAALDKAHRDAVHSAMEYIESQITRGRHDEKGHIAWISFDHYAAREIVNIAIDKDTRRQEIPEPGDPTRHTHVVVPNMVWNEARTVALQTQALAPGARRKEFGAIYQAFLSANLQKLGVDIGLDSKHTWGMRLNAVPDSICKTFSKRTRNAEESARRFVKKHNMDWDAMSPDQRYQFLRRGHLITRRDKRDGLADLEGWKREAASVGYEHKSVLNPERARTLAPLHERERAAYEASLPYLETQLQRHSRFKGEVARTAAAWGFVVPGIQNPGPEIYAVIQAYRTEGVQQNGQKTALTWGKSADETFATFTTQLHVEQEREAIDLLRKAADDKSVALNPAHVERWVRAVAQERGFDFTTEAGQRQREMISALAGGGRAGVGIGVAGSGKTTVLYPLVRAWQDQSREVYGTTLAWRQTGALAEAGVGRKAKRRWVAQTGSLTEAGVAEDRAMALATFIRRAEKGELPLNDKSVVIVDEIAQVSTHQILHLARLREKHNFQIVGLGDQLQCQAIEAGHTIRLFQKALGPDQVPELLNTIRQLHERDRETSLMFREGRAHEALERKQSEGTLVVTPGGYEQAVVQAVNLWENRRKLNLKDYTYSIGLSAPTNEDARAIGAEIRKRRRAAGELHPHDFKIKAIDQTKKEYDLAIAVGDRLRLFNKSFVHKDGKRLTLGVNGSVVTVMDINARGMKLRNTKDDVEGFVAWNSRALRDKATGRMRLTYGDALTIDSRQGDTLTEHITVMPAGSQAVQGYKAYTAESRHRRQSWIVTSQGEELAEVLSKRPWGDARNFEPTPEETQRAIIANMARNMSRQEEKMLATDFVEAARDVKVGSVDGRKATWNRPPPVQTAPPVPTTNYARPAPPPVTEPTPAAPVVNLRPPRRILSETEAQSEFADAMHRFGLRPEGPVVMDGKIHYARVDGNKGKKMSGWYIGHFDAHPAGAFGNFRTGEKTSWRASAPTRSVDDKERDAQRMLQEVARRQREDERRQKEEETARKSLAAWNYAVAATKHPYTTKKGVAPEGLRVNSRNELLIPMRDGDGKLWNLQRITPDGEKLFNAGRKRGLFHVLGKPDEQGIIVAEGYATAKTIRDSTALTTVVAFDSGNLAQVAESLRKKFPGSPLAFGADNDEHLTRRNPPQINAGLKGAEAAKRGDEKVIAPPHEPHLPDTDWNDYARRYGNAAVREAFLGRKELSQEQRDAARLRATAKQNRYTEMTQHRTQERKPSLTIK